MNKPNPTQGPWEHHFLSGMDRIVGPNGECIAETGRWKESEWPEMHANARLIAAAPALLEALKLSLDYYRSHGTKKYNPYEVEQSLERAIHLAEGRG